MMKTKILAIMLVVSLMAVPAFALHVEFTDAGSDSLWSNNNNWTRYDSGVPTTPYAPDVAAEKVIIVGGLTCTLDSVTLTQNNMELYGGGVLNIVAGGVLTIDGALSIYGVSAGDAGTAINLNGGTIRILTAGAGLVGADFIFGEDGNNFANGGVVIDTTSEPGYTLYTAGYYSNPTPADGNLYVDPSITEFSWSLPADPGVGTKVTVWFEDVNDIHTPIVGPNDIGATSITLAAASVVLAEDTEYTWRIKTIDPNNADTIEGNVEVVLSDDIYTFSTYKAVVAGDDLVTFLTESIVGVDVLMAASVVNPDGDTTENSWTFTKDPVGIADPNFSDPPDALDVTVTFYEAGTYTLTLTVDGLDADPVEDSLVVTVYKNACAAAQLPADLDGDCDIDLADFSMLAKDWLKDNSYQR